MHINYVLNTHQAGKFDKVVTFSTWFVWQCGIVTADLAQGIFVCNYFNIYLWTKVRVAHAVKSQIVLLTREGHINAIIK